MAVTSARSKAFVASHGHDGEFVHAAVAGRGDVTRMSKATSGILRRLAVLPPPPCPGVSRASTSCLVTLKNVDGRDEHGHDGFAISARKLGPSARGDLHLLLDA